MCTCLAYVGTSLQQTAQSSQRWKNNSMRRGVRNLMRISIPSGEIKHVHRSCTLHVPFQECICLGWGICWRCLTFYMMHLKQAAEL